MLKIEIKLVEEKLMRESGSFGREVGTTNGFREEAYQLLEWTPDCLKQNILEWLFDLPFSEIEYKGITYTQFIQKLNTSSIFKNTKYTFDFLFNKFVYYADSNQNNKILEKSFGWTSEE